MNMLVKLTSDQYGLEFKNLQEKARSNGTGLWVLDMCNGMRVKILPQQVAPVSPAPA